MFETLRSLYQELEAADLLLLLNAQERRMKEMKQTLERRGEVIKRLNDSMSRLSTVSMLQDLKELKRMHSEAVARDTRISDVMTQARDILRNDWQKVSPAARLNQSPYGHKQPRRKITL